MVDDVAARARMRIREQADRNKLTQRDISNVLGGTPAGWSQSRVAKLLSGRVELGVNDLASLCFAVGISVVEAVRDHDLEFLAEMTPFELRLLERFREVPPNFKDAITTILAVKPVGSGRVERRRGQSPQSAPPAPAQKKR